jgi:hypothetical protein
MKSRHLAENQIVRAIVDAENLLPSWRNHLDTCERCRNAKNRLEADLDRLGRLAIQNVPAPRKELVLPATTKPFIRSLLAKYPKTITAAAATLAGLLLIWATAVMRSPTSVDGLQSQYNIVEAERFMKEVNTLVENALPFEFLVLSAETPNAWDEEFLEFLIPTADDDTLTPDLQRRISAS